jgi:hypothetical protein
LAAFGRIDPLGKLARSRINVFGGGGMVRRPVVENLIAFYGVTAPIIHHDCGYD